MKITILIANFTRAIVFGTLALALSCTDHEVPTNLPESQCKTVSGTDRLYPCEFVIEKLTFLDKDGLELGSVTGSLQSISVSRFKATTNTNLGTVAGESGAATFDVRLTLKRVSNPSFPINEGYLLGFTNNPAGKMVLHTPKFAGDTYGERSEIGAPLALDMSVGESRDLTFSLLFPYQLVDMGMAGVSPNPIHPYTSIFIDNDVTTLAFDRNAVPYNYVGSVVEAYFEKIRVILTN